MGEPLNKVVLITGAARRVGAGLARALAEAGWDVAVHHRGGADEAAALVADLSAKGVRAAAFQADLNERGERDGLIARQKDPADQRRSVVSATPKGLQLAEQLAKDIARHYLGLEQAFGKDKLEDLYLLLDQLIALERL